MKKSMLNVGMIARRSWSSSDDDPEEAVKQIQRS